MFDKTVAVTDNDRQRLTSPVQTQKVSVCCKTATLRVFYVLPPVFLAAVVQSL